MGGGHSPLCMRSLLARASPTPASGSSASVTLVSGGIYIVISSDELALELLSALGECCKWERDCTMLPKKEYFATLIMWKGFDSDAVLRRQLPDLQRACDCIADQIYGTS